MSDDTPQRPIPDELKIDVDQEKLADWDKVSGDYAGEGEPEKHRPAFTDRSRASDDDPDGTHSAENTDNADAHSAGDGSAELVEALDGPDAGADDKDDDAHHAAPAS